MKYVNFGDKIIQYIKMLYNNIESTVINIGNTVDYFKLESGVRQWCPIILPFYSSHSNLSKYNKIWKNIKGININNKTIKLSILANKLTLILTNVGSVENALKLLNKFTQCSGLKN